jgi:hypothetical protein
LILAAVVALVCRKYALYHWLVVVFLVALGLFELTVVKVIDAEGLRLHSVAWTPGIAHLLAGAFARVAVRTPTARTTRASTAALPGTPAGQAGHRQLRLMLVCAGLGLVMAGGGLLAACDAAKNPTIQIPNDPGFPSLPGMPGGSPLPSLPPGFPSLPSLAPGALPIPRPPDLPGALPGQRIEVRP